MSNHTIKDSSERLQVITLTFAFTGGCFALLTLLLRLFFIPGAEAEARQSEKSYADLVATLQRPQSKDLRANAKRGENQDNTSTLAEIVKLAGDRRGVKLPTLPPPTITQKAGLEERKIKVMTDPAKLADLIHFAAAVQDSKKTIQVEGISFKRDNRSKPEDQHWIGTVEFIDYVTK